MWTDEQEFQIRNTLAREVLTPKLIDYSLRVATGKVHPTRLAEIEIIFEMADMKNNVSMIHLSDTLIENILDKCGVTGYTLGMTSTSVFKDEVHFDVYVHFGKGE